MLTSGVWPLKAAATPALRLPPELERSRTQLALFYGDQHPDRKLTWLWALGNGELIVYHGALASTIKVWCAWGHGVGLLARLLVVTSPAGHRFRCRCTRWSCSYSSTSRRSCR